MNVFSSKNKGSKSTAVAAAAASSAPKIGGDVSKYNVKRTLGTGSFGRVKLVQRKSDKQEFAMKMLYKSVVVQLKQVQHIKNERMVLDAINRDDAGNLVGFPFLIKMEESFQDKDCLYLVMEVVDGGELFYYLRRDGRFSPEAARFYAAQVVLAIEHMHNKNIVYRDLKPENILLDRSGHLKLTDFGFAKFVTDKTWTFCGTPEYVAPEIILTKGHGKPADWWAVGILLFEMLGGYTPFYDDDPLKLYEKIVYGRIVFPSHFSSEAKDLIKKLLTADLTKRLGNLKNGVNDIKGHKFFKGISWSDLLKCSGRYSRGPITPNPRAFQEYADALYAGPDEKPPPSSASYNELFADF